MPRGTNKFRHEVEWAPDALDNQHRYSAKVADVKLKGGKITVIWTIYKAFKSPKRRKAPTPKV